MPVSLNVLALFNLELTSPEILCANFCLNLCSFDLALVLAVASIISFSILALQTLMRTAKPQNVNLHTFAVSGFWVRLFMEEWLQHSIIKNSNLRNIQSEFESDLTFCEQLIEFQASRFCSMELGLTQIHPERLQMLKRASLPSIFNGALVFTS